MPISSSYFLAKKQPNLDYIVTCFLVSFVSYVKTRSHHNFCTFGWTFWITSTRGFHSSFNGSRHDTIYHPFGGLAICERTPGIYPKRKERGRFAGFASFATTGRPHILSMTDKIGLPRAILWGRKETFSIANDLQSVFLASFYLCYTSRHKAPTVVSRGSLLVAADKLVTWCSSGKCTTLLLHPIPYYGFVYGTNFLLLPSPKILKVI